MKILRGETAGVRFISAQEVYKPGTLEVVEAPKDLVSWFQDHPYLKTSKQKPATVGGLKGKQFDVVVDDLPQDYYGACGSDCVDIFSSSGGAGWIALRDGDKGYVIVLEDVNGETVSIGIASLAGDFDEFAPEAEKVLESVKWTGS